MIRNGELLAAVHKLNVFPVSPNTLVITLRAIAMSISQYEFAQSVEKTLAQIRQAQKRFTDFQKRLVEQVWFGGPCLQFGAVGIMLSVLFDLCRG